LNFGNSIDLANGADDLGGNLPWRFAHDFGQFKAEGKGEVAHLSLWRLFNDQLAQSVPIVILDMSDKAVFDFFSQRHEHAVVLGSKLSNSETPNPSTLQ
jgi:hypothetical protein